MKYLIPTRLLILSAFITSSVICKAQTGSTFDSLIVNNIGARINNLGDNFVNPDKHSSAFIVPAHNPENLSTIYASSLWIGGYEKGNLKIAAMTYRQSGVDFFPGPLDTVTGTIGSGEKNSWNHVWRIEKKDIDNFLATRNITAPISDWPGNGNASFDESKIMAPFVDVDHDGIYNPQKGDYPDMKGDEMIWWVMNDNGGSHTETHGAPLGIEVHGEAYAYHTADDINNTIFVDYKIINKSNTTIDSAYVGLWTDFDLGYAYDDYIGSAPKSNTYYVYNGESFDPGVTGYGANPPIESVLFLKDSMSKFLFYANTASPVNGNPGYPNANPGDYYNYLRGFWKNDTCMKYGSIDGIKGTQCTDFMFDGTPGDTNVGWTMPGSGALPTDVRGLGSIGPLTLKPGQVYDLPVAYIYSRSNSNLNYTYKTTEQDWKDVRDFYESENSGIKVELPENEQMEIFPNPANTMIQLNTGIINFQNVTIRDIAGRTVIGIPNFEGKSIKVSQLPDGIYFVTAQSRTGVMSQKLVIER